MCKEKITRYIFDALRLPILLDKTFSVIFTSKSTNLSS